MAGQPPSNEKSGGRLHRCIRDLAALNALPSMCIGRTPDQALDIVLDALPTALSCDLIYIALPGAPPRGSLHRAPLDEAQLAALQPPLPELDAQLDLPGAGKLWCLEAELPIAGENGRLVAGRRAPMDLETDRVLVRSAANLVATTLETAKVLEAARRKDEFLAMLGHELRNPLAPILTAIDLLRLRGLQIVEKERQIIDRQARHLARLVDDLLDVSRASSGKIVLAKQRIELRDVVATSVEMTRALIDERGHQLEVQVAREGLLVDADPARLAQAISNLLTNAAKYTEPGGRIALDARRTSAARVEISVTDNGIGIEPEMIGRVFDLFVQERQALDRARGGLGVGLSIVRSLIALHGGTVIAHSEGRGRGTTITIELPLQAKSEDQPAASQSAAPPSSSRRSLRLLIVDDNRDAAELLTLYLESIGHSVRYADDGPTALRAAADFLPDVVLLDIGLPVMDGYEVARRLREQERGQQMRLIALTGYGQEDDKRRAKDASFDAHLVKPVRMTELEETIWKLISAATE